MSRIFNAEFSEFKEIISYIKDRLISLNLNDETVNTAHIICDEFVTNVIKNAYQKDASDTYCIDGIYYKKPLRIKLDKTLNRLSIELSDWGCPFNPLEHDDDISEKESGGGFGIHIAKNLADFIEYERKGDRNILTLYIDPR